MALSEMATNPRYGKYKIGKHTYGDPRIEDFGDHATLEIGSFCSFARDVTILLSGEHHINWVTTSPLAHLLKTPDGKRVAGPRWRDRYSQNGAKGNVVIGSDVWVGLGATILSGVTIDHGAVIGAQAVVTKDVPPYGIAAGNPAEFIRWRFPQITPGLMKCESVQYRWAGTPIMIPTVISRLLATAWWDWPDEKIRQFMPLLMSEKVTEFLDKAETP